MQDSDLIKIRKEIKEFNESIDKIVMEALGITKKELYEKYELINTVHNKA